MYSVTQPLRQLPEDRCDAPLLTYVSEAERQEVHALAQRAGYSRSLYLREVVRRHLAEQVRPAAGIGTSPLGTTKAAV